MIKTISFRLFVYSLRLLLPFVVFTQLLPKKEPFPYKNFAYAGEKLQSLDLLLPQKIKEGTPLVILVHGGSWFFGEKESLRPIQEYLYKQNIPSANINYRLGLGKITYKEQLEDIHSAIRFLYKNAEKLQIPTQFIMMGESAGGHLALLYSYQNPHRVSKIISLSAPTDFYSERYTEKTLYHWYTKRIFEWAVGAKYSQENTDAFMKASPSAQASYVPTLIFQGTGDIIVDESQAYSLVASLKENFVPHRLVLMEGGQHFLRRISYWREQVIFPEILDFIHKPTPKFSHKDISTPYFKHKI